MKITLLVVGKMKSHPAAAIIEDYTKRIPWDIHVTELEIKQSLEGIARIEKEGALILEALPRHARVVVCDERGKNISSAAFADRVAEWQGLGDSHIVCVIGGAYGLSDAVRQRADLVLSFGKMTWPHMLVRSMLVEQLYRAYTILTGHPYHK